MKKILVTGSQGFIGSYVCAELLAKGYKVIGIDNFSKYGPIVRTHDDHPNFTLIERDVIDIEKDIPKEILDVDFIIALAAMIGGITYFHKYAYDLLATNERIIASTFDLAIKLFKEQNLKKILVLSSSMVFERTENYPTPESEVEKCPPGLSTYAFQKLACEYFCKGAFEQYGLPYTIIRPFNCVGVGEQDAIGEHEVKSGNIKLMMSHVLPDLVNKILKGQSPLHILGNGEQIRCYTNGKDIGTGIRLCLESENALNEDFNISTSEAMNVKELATIAWNILKPNDKLEFIEESSFEYDVQKRIPDTSKAKRLLGFEAQISVKESVKEVVEWMKNQKSV